MVSPQDELYMNRAIELAKTRKGETHPNPTVGCVIVKNGKVVGEGFHRRAGEPHAEVVALQRAGKNAEGSTVYVTLEPCSHYGRTPPCSLALIRAKVRRVVVATADPNPRVSGKGIQMLKNAGVEVEVGLLEEEARRLNEDFFKWIKMGLPFVTLKVAQSLDGFIAAEGGISKWITNERSRKFVHKMRCEASAVLVGVGTILKDNPLLTVRDYYCEKQPLRVVLDTRLKTPLESFVTDTSIAPTVIFTSENTPSEKIKPFETRGVEVVKVKETPEGLDLKEVLRELGKREVLHLLVEGGAKIFGGFYKNNLFDRLAVFIAPKVLGSGIKTFGEGFFDTPDKKGLRLEEVKTFGEDVFISYRKGF
jgi:diaminohydroxyphosphoribosylaminopyrimidine deaminase/5-amino-6-(5-phosphoribosylamino)uracil reductase